MQRPKRKSPTTTTIVVQPPLNRRPSFQASLVGLAGNVFGNRYLLGQEKVSLGRDPASSDITVDDSGVSRLHAEIIRTPLGHRLRDLGSKNGTMLDGDIITEADIKDGQQISIGKSVLKYLRLNVVELQYHDKMTRLSSTDELTGLFNRRHAWDTMEQEIARSLRHERPLSIILFDVDHFKRVNDNYGHVAGDACLVEIAKRVGTVTRREDVLARIGGEEFIAILPDCEILEAAELATRIRDVIAETPLPAPETNIPVTVSLGVTDIEELQLTHGLDGHEEMRGKVVDLFVTLADAKLYEAKHLGRNRVAV